MMDNGQDLANKICIVTGATSGIGAVAARRLTERGATVIIVGRNAHKCVRQVGRIRGSFHNRHVDYLVADLSSQKEVRRLAQEVNARFQRVDVLINNAGGYFEKREVSDDGLEMTFALNHLGYFLLTDLLLGRLKASPSARIINVSSSAHAEGKINFQDLQAEQHYDRTSAYAQSKFANLLFTYALARRLKGSRVTANALHPGLVATNLGSNNSWLKVKLRNLLRRKMLSPEEGAKTVVYLATSPEVEGISGKYFYESKPIRSSDESYDVAMAEKLWEVSERLVGIDQKRNDAGPK